MKGGSFPVLTAYMAIKDSSMFSSYCVEASGLADAMNTFMRIPRSAGSSGFVRKMKRFELRTSESFSE